MDNAVVVGVGNIFMRPNRSAAGIARPRGQEAFSRALSETGNRDQTQSSPLLSSAGGTTLRALLVATVQPGYFHRTVCHGWQTTLQVCGHRPAGSEAGSAPSVFCPRCQS